MTATLTIPNGMSADLDARGRWSCSDETLSKALNANYGPDRYQPSPAAGILPSGDAIRAAAQAFGGTIVWSLDSSPDLNADY